MTVTRRRRLKGLEVEPARGPDIEAVRIADMEDKPEVMRLLVEAHDENGLVPYHLPKVEWWLDRMLNPDAIPAWDTQPRGVIGVIGGKRLKGLAILIIGSIWYATERHLEELIVFVPPEHRAQWHHNTLIEWMKEQSRSTGLRLMAGILSDKPRIEAKIRLYERKLPKAGAVFCFDPLTQISTAICVMH